jgi:putative hydrolase of the HAD superfamily
MSAPSETQSIAVILFDLGGVLVELAGMQILQSWTGLDEANMWKKWLTSEIVREFEIGHIPPAEFAEGAVAEFKLPISPQEFLDGFQTWPSGTYPGVKTILETCAKSHHLGCLSNTNPIHWPIMRDDFGLGRYFEVSFISYEIGLLKPDEDIYRYVIDQLQIQPARIMYFDDNPLNIDAAAACGITSYLCQGGEQLTRLIAENIHS